MIAAMFNHADIVTLLLEHGADVRAHSDNGSTAIEAARALGAPDAVAILAERLAQTRG